MIAEVGQISKFADVAGDWTRVVVPASLSGSRYYGVLDDKPWHRYEESLDAPEEFSPDGVTLA